MANTINVTSDTVVKLIIRRGTNIDRQNIILSNGELGYAYDIKRVFVGDGVTQGGNLVGNINFGIIQGIETYNGVAQAGDIIFQNTHSDGTVDNTLYAFNNQQWQPISPVYSLPLPSPAGPLTNAQGYVNFNPNYFYMDNTTPNLLFNVYGGVTSYTVSTGTLSANTITIYNQPVYGTDGVNYTTLLSGITTSELFTVTYTNNHYIPLSGQTVIFGTLSCTTNISLSTPPFYGYDLTNKNYVDLSINNAIATSEAYTSNRFLHLSGGTLTGNLISNVTSNSDPAVYIQQYGAGAALRIEDTNYNGTSPFIVDNFGSVGCGGAPRAGGNQDGVPRLSIFGALSSSGNAIFNGDATINSNLYINKNNYAAIELGNNVNGQGFTITKESADNSFNIWTNILGAGTNRLKIDQAGNIAMAVYGGNVGIGTNNPSQALEVSGNIKANGEVIGTLADGVAQFRAVSNNYGAIIRNDDTNTYLLLTNSGDAYGSWKNVYPFVVNNASGNVGIGGAASSTGTALQVYGSSTITGTLLANGTISSNSDIIAFASSDERLKNNITPITSALDKIEHINGVEYDWNTELQDIHTGHDVGVIAQEVEQILPEAVITRNDGYKAVNYDKVIPLLLQAIKELKAEVRSLKQ